MSLAMEAPPEAKKLRVGAEFGEVLLPFPIQRNCKICVNDHLCVWLPMLIINSLISDLSCAI